MSGFIKFLDSICTILSQRVTTKFKKTKGKASATRQHSQGSILP